MIYLNQIIIKRGHMFWYETEKPIKKGHVIKVKEEGKFLVTRVEFPDVIGKDLIGPANVYVSRIK